MIFSLSPELVVLKCGPPYSYPRPLLHQLMVLQIRCQWFPTCAHRIGQLLPRYIVQKKGEGFFAAFMLMPSNSPGLHCVWGPVERGGRGLWLRHLLPVCQSLVSMRPLALLVWQSACVICACVQVHVPLMLAGKSRAKQVCALNEVEQLHQVCGGLRGLGCVGCACMHACVLYLPKPSSTAASCGPTG